MLHPNTIYELRIARIGTGYKLLAVDSRIVDAHWEYEKYDMLSSVLTLPGFTPTELLSLTVRLNSSAEVALSTCVSRKLAILGIPQPD